MKAKFERRRKEVMITKNYLDYPAFLSQLEDFTICLSVNCLFNLVSANEL